MRSQFAPPRRGLPNIGHAGVLLLLTLTALLIHGYHPFSEDAGIYVPQIRRLLHPALYPFGSQFFETHARLTFFPNLVAALVRLTRLPLSVVLFVCHLASIFLLLFVCLRIASKCFPTGAGRWGAVALVAALLTLPATGTALYLLDPYFNPRSISTFAILFAVDAALERKPLRAVLWLIFTGLIHPLMIVFGAFYVALIALTQNAEARKRMQAASGAAIAIAAPGFLHPSAEFFQSLRDHPYYFVLRWRWYEWIGIFAPLAILWWLSRIADAKRRPAFKTLAFSLIPFGAACFAGALIVSIPRIQMLLIGQPMRGFQLLYLLMVLLAGGLLGEIFLKRRVLLWIALFLPICAGMGYAQFELYPADPHVEWPGASSTNPWVQAFTWIRANTPEDAIFALDPNYMALRDEDHQGFRAIAARSSLADAVKDWSASAMFPGLPLATEVSEQVHAAQGWRSFGLAGFERLKKTYGAAWVVLDRPPPAGLVCPYQNRRVIVCRVP
ncbi:MAG TPA: hypothetical protein VJR26_11515 [Candidatus Acidoferrales bacterium]|nr:hypothetical protein [Candidatus Acidoferrales bacterium]